MNWRDVIGREVVDTSTAGSIGHIDAIVIDPDSSSITALVVGDKVVSWSEAGGIGPDALTLTSADLLRAADPGPETTAVEGGAHLMSKAVYTEDGYALGELQDIEFDSQTGEIAQLVLANEHVSGSRLIGVGSFAVVVSSPDHEADS